MAGKKPGNKQTKLSKVNEKNGTEEEKKDNQVLKSKFAQIKAKLVGKKMEMAKRKENKTEKMH